MSMNNLHDESRINKLAELIKNSKKIFVLTGAGISTKSGIPDFRSGTGIYSKYPELVFDIDVFYNDPTILYNLMFELAPIVINAKPNIAHICLKKLEDMGKINLIATQNIDMLHEKAGSIKVANLHGSMKTFTCIKCGKKHPLEYAMKFITKKEIAKCSLCGGVLRPDFVFFKEPLPEEALAKAQKAAKEADLIMVIGSTLLVFPAGYIPMYGVTKGTPLVIITKGETALDNYATIKIEDDIVEVCKKLMEKLNLTN